jgi:hypothetical protein
LVQPSAHLTQRPGDPPFPPAAQGWALRKAPNSCKPFWKKKHENAKQP